MHIKLGGGAHYPKLNNFWSGISRSQLPKITRYGAKLSRSPHVHGSCSHCHRRCGRASHARVVLDALIKAVGARMVIRRGDRFWNRKLESYLFFLPILDSARELVFLLFPFVGFIFYCNIMGNEVVRSRSDRVMTGFPFLDHVPDPICLDFVLIHHVFPI